MEFHFWILAGSLSTTVTWISGDWSAVIAAVGPPDFGVSRVVKLWAGVWLTNVAGTNKADLLYWRQ